MSTLIKELNEKRAKQGAEVKKLRDKFEEQGGEWKDDQKGHWERANKEYEETTSKLKEARDILNRASDIDDFKDKDIPDGRDKNGRDQDLDGEVTSRQRDLAISGWCRSQYGVEISEEERQACRATGVNPGSKELRFSLPTTEAYRDLQALYRDSSRQSRSRLAKQARDLITTGSVSNVISEQFLTDLEMATLKYGGIRELAETMITSTGEPLNWPTANDTANEGALVGEQTDLGASVDPTFAKTTWSAFKYSSKPILISQEALEDSYINIAGLLPGMFGERLGRITSKHFTTGDGVGKPRGLMLDSPVGVTAAAQNAITFDELIQLEHSVDESYWNGASYAFHSNILLAIKLLKDLNGQYLWRMGTEGTPDTVNGRNYATVSEMANSIVAGAEVAVFGQLSKYKIRRVNEVRLYRLQELYRVSDDSDGFVALMREDGRLLDAGTNPVKKLQMAP